MKLVEATKILGLVYPIEDTPTFREALKKAWKRIARDFHPDMIPAGATPEERIAAEETFKSGNAAHQAINVALEQGRTQDPPAQDESLGDEGDEEDDPLWGVLEEIKDVMISQAQELRRLRSEVQRLTARVDELSTANRELQEDLGDLGNHVNALGTDMAAFAQRAVRRPAPPGRPLHLGGVLPGPPPPAAPAGVPTPGPTLTNALRGLDVLIEATRAVRGRKTGRKPR